MRIVNIVGTRPNIVKVAAMMAAQRERADLFDSLLVHTGQHREPAMSQQLFEELGLPAPDVTLPTSSGSQLAQISGMMQQLEDVLAELRPDLVIVVGDVNSTAAGALAAATSGIPVAHVEAGLRCFDREMPEEINRVVVDAVSEHLFASEESAVANLRAEGRPEQAIHHVGNVMIDTLKRCRPAAAARHPARQLGITGPYGVLTLHRPSNVDRPGTLSGLLRAAAEISERIPIVFPIHPRTRDRLQACGLDVALRNARGIHAAPPLGYIDMLALMERAQVVLTDSGGVQEESTFLGVPCLTLRESTERPATVDCGTNRVIGTRPQRIVAEVHRLLDGDWPVNRVPALWDGEAASRIVTTIADRVLSGRVASRG